MILYTNVNKCLTSETACVTRGRSWTKGYSVILYTWFNLKGAVEQCRLMDGITQTTSKCLMYEVIGHGGHVWSDGK